MALGVGAEQLTDRQFNGVGLPPPARSVALGQRGRPRAGQDLRQTRRVQDDPPIHDRRVGKLEQIACLFTSQPRERMRLPDDPRRLFHREQPVHRQCVFVVALYVEDTWEVHPLPVGCAQRRIMAGAPAAGRKSG